QDGGGGGQRGALEHAVELVAKRRHDDPQRLGNDDPAHTLPIGHAQRLCRLELTHVDGINACADDLRHVGALVEGERQQGAEQSAYEILVCEAILRFEVEGLVERVADAQERKELPEEYDLHDEGSATEDPDVDVGELAEHDEARAT